MPAMAEKMGSGEKAALKMVMQVGMSTGRAGRRWKVWVVVVRGGKRGVDIVAGGDGGMRGMVEGGDGWRGMVREGW